MPKTPATNTLFYGDNLDILREYTDDESVDHDDEARGLGGGVL